MVQLSWGEKMDDTRRIPMPDGGFLLEDLSVGMSATFARTVTEADIIVHVRDAHHPDSAAQKADVLAVLRDLGLEALVEEGLIEVMNKTDLLEPSARAALSNQVERRNTDTVALSAVTGEGCDRLLQLVDGRLDAGLRAVRLDVPLSDGRTLAWIYAHGEVLGRRDDAEAAHLSVRLTEADLGRLRHPAVLEPADRGSVVAIGNFDGVHQGHQIVIGRTAEIARGLGARLAVLTFEPHPFQVFHPEAPPFRLTPFRAKARHLEPAPGARLPPKGVDAIVVSAAGSAIAKPLAGAGRVTPGCQPTPPAPDEPHENPRSTGFQLRFGSAQVVAVKIDAGRRGREGAVGRA